MNTSYLREVKSSKAFGVLSPETAVIVEAVIAAATVIKKNSHKGDVKPGEGHRSIVTVADRASQKIIFRQLLARFPQARILAEEATSHPAALSPRNPAGILCRGLYFIVDPIDGTTSFSHQQGDWSIGVGVIRNGIFLGGSILAPAMNGGFLVFAERGKVTFFKEEQGPVR